MLRKNIRPVSIKVCAIGEEYFFFYWQIAQGFGVQDQLRAPFLADSELTFFRLSVLDASQLLSSHAPITQQLLFLTPIKNLSITGVNAI